MYNKVSNVLITANMLNCMSAYIYNYTLLHGTNQNTQESRLMGDKSKFHENKIRCEINFNLPCEEWSYN